MITASIVLFNENIETLKKTVHSFLETPTKKKLYLLDNSSQNIALDYFKHPEIEYFFVGKNIGFGKAHNLILDKIDSDFHLILNPDVEFSSKVIPALTNELIRRPEVSFVTPKVMYPNKKRQEICRDHPTFFDLINRKLGSLKSVIYNNEQQHKNIEKPFYPAFIHGCFMLFKTKDFKKIHGFDERFFLYMEDADICRKIDAMGKKKLYYPHVEIIHQHRRGSSKNIKLFFTHISSAIKYFLKWGF